MTPFDLAALLLLAAAGCGYINHRLLRLPPTSGMLTIALVSSLAVVAADLLLPRLGARAMVTAILERIDFNALLMNGMLSFLLFAGALHVDLGALNRNKLSIAALATVGVAISAGLIGGLVWGIFHFLYADVPLVQCFVFGALISPTDPIAVIGLLRELRAPQDLETQIAGESLFNDGVGVVLFVGLVSLAGLPTGEGALHAIDARSILAFVSREVGGGIAAGLAVGYVAYRALKTVDEHALELLMTLALVMCVYAVCLHLHLSGPIAVVVAGLLIGNHGRQFAMSERTRDHVDAFWQMIDEVLNAVLFLLIGLEVITVRLGPGGVPAVLLAIPAVVLARFVAVAVPITVLKRRPRPRGLIVILTWSGLRGGLSVAMALSLPPFPARELILAATYAVVVFTILVQGLTVRRLLVHYGVGEPSSAAR